MIIFAIPAIRLNGGNVKGIRCEKLTANGKCQKVYVYIKMWTQGVVYPCTGTMNMHITNIFPMFLHQSKPCRASMGSGDFNY